MRLCSLGYDYKAVRGLNQLLGNVSTVGARTTSTYAAIAQSIAASRASTSLSNF